ncbi:Homeodomain-like [Phytophthora cactorum]|nr:Homeodomain-like [Phytophthora cactorum]
MGGWMRIKMKRAMIKHNYERPGLSQRELAAAKVQFKLKKAPAQTTVSDILKHAATIMDEAYGDE